jgi:Ion channel
MLTPQQHAALDDLMSHVPEPANPAPMLDSFLGAFLGLSATDIREKLSALTLRKDALEDRVRDWVEANPLDSALTFLAGSAWAFYAAEKGINPKVETYVDAFYYISTSASVGYADTFPMTQRGKAIASLVMMLGPSLAGRALDRPKR